MLDSTTQARARSIAKMAVDALRTNNMDRAVQLLTDSPEPAITLLLMIGFDRIQLVCDHQQLLRALGYDGPTSWLVGPIYTEEN